MPTRLGCTLALSLTTSLLIGQGAAGPDPRPRFVQYPDIHGDQVVFTYEGDLWTGTVQGGPARRLTSHPGNEFAAHFSPDGKWLAFSGQYDGGTNVYLMPAQGGEVRRLTWRGNCVVQGWSPDGKVLFRTALSYDCGPINQVYAVDLQGHEPQPVMPGKAFQAAFSPDGQQLLYNPKGNEEYYWKRYKGGQHPELWLADLKGGSYRRVTPYNGKSAYPMWSAQGQALFVSDRGPGGVANLYTLDLPTGEGKALTSFQDFDVQWPATDGHRVVFVQGGYLQVLDLADGASRPLAITAPSDGWRWAPRTVNAKTDIQSVQLAADGKELVLEARGDVFRLPTDSAKPALNLTHTSGVRERVPVLSPDGKRVAYQSDASGEYDLYVQPAAGGPATRLATGLHTTLYHMAWSPDSTKLLFSDKTFTIYTMEVATGKLETIATSHQLKNDQFTWEVADYTWSPDSNWIAYSFAEPNHNNRIFLYNLKTKAKTAVTNGFFDSLNPCFDADGSTLYFLSYSDFKVQLDPGEMNAIESEPVRVMAVKLRKDDPAGPFRIDTEGLEERISALPVKAGNYFHLKAGKGVVGWSSAAGWDDGVVEEVFRPKGEAKWTMHFYEAASKKETDLAEPVSEWGFNADGTAVYVKVGQALHAGPVQALLAAKALPESVDLERLAVTVTPREEWTQIFEDTWRWYREFFYDTNMHGQNWKALHDRYAAWLPQMTSRQDLNWLLSQMVGELCVSHTYVGGGDLGPAPAPGLTRSAGLLGADLSPAENGRYRFNKVYGPTPYAPELKAPLAGKVHEGEYLLAVDGQPVPAGDPVYQHLQVVPGQKVTLTVNSRPSMDGARTVEVQPVTSDSELRYQAWIAGNIATVEKLSNGQFGYMHLTAMMGPNIGEFDKYWRAFRYRKGIVVDVRGNHGGWTEYFMINKLENRQVGFNVLRGMAPFRYPGTAGDGRYVFLSNEQNGSDGEAFLAHVKALNMGPIVGVPSWGGLVGIVNTQLTLDGGRVEQSNNAFYGKEGQWWIENHGAEPDVRVENDPATVAAGHDRQLEVAVETLQKQLAENPTATFPPVPQYPKK
jgi:tricorn protease